MYLKACCFIASVGFVSAMFCQNLYKTKDAELGNLVYSDDSLHKIDSLKWVMYAMNHYKKAAHFKFDSLPELSVLECSVKFKGIDNSRNDTTMYPFFFYRGDESNVYSPNNFYFSGIGYSHKTKNSFPLLSHAYPTFAENTDSCKVFFEKREKEFVDYLKTYTGKLAPWLRDEAIRRRIIYR